MQDIPQDIMDKHGYITFVIDLKYGHKGFHCKQKMRDSSQANGHSSERICTGQHKNDVRPKFKGNVISAILKRILSNSVE